MNLAKAHEHARNAKTMHQAARLHNDIDYELALGEHSPDEERQGEEALRHLQERFPGVQEQAREVDQPPALSNSARRNLHGPTPARSSRGRGEHTGGRRPAAPKPDRRPARSGQRASTPRRVRQAADAATGRVGRAATTAYQAADDTSGGLIGYVLLGGMALSLFYLFLTRAAAAGKLFQGATNAVRAVVSPTVDPLNPKGALL